MYRQLYQMGGIGTLPMDYGQSLQVPQQPQPSFSSAQNITMNPLLNYGQPQLGQAGGTPLSMRSGGISRLGYQEGGMGMDQMMEPQMQDPMMQEQMMQSQMQQAPEGIMSMMPQEASGGQQGMPQEGGQEETALLTIIQLLIEQGVPPEQAQELAMQILQVFNQGGAPAVEEFATQLEQEEGMSDDRTMMAGGGITGIYPRQGYFVGKIAKGIGKAVKGVANAVKSVAKSPIGQIALAIAAPYAIAALPGMAGFATLGGSGFMGAALRAGISNLAIQGITTGKINPKQALLAAAAGGALSGLQGADAMAAKDAMNAGDYMQYGSSVQEGLGTSIPLKSGVIPSDIGSYDQSVQKMYDTSMITPSESDILSNVKESNLSNAQGKTLQQLGEVKPMNMFEKGISNIQDFGTNLMNDPMKTIKTGIGSIYDTATQTIKDNPLLSVGGAFLAGQQFRAPLPNEDPNEYNRLKAEHDAQVAGYVTQYGGASNVYSPGSFGLYAREKAIDPFAGRSSYAADGGYITNRQNYFLGKRVSAVATPQSEGSTGGGSGMGGMMARFIQQNSQMFKPQSTTVRQPRTAEFIDINQNGIDDRDEGMMYGGRAGYAEGSISFERKTLERKGYSDMMKNMTPKEISQLYDSVIGTFSRRFQAEGTMPMGEPRKNPAGIMELDYRAKGGFVPPVGIKEKADDIPAMLSNNEFVFTADAVRNAGGGNVNKGAQRMYGLMKQLEAGGRV